MSVAGIAGSLGPEVDGVFLGESLFDGFWYASFGQHAQVDIWQVRTTGLRIRQMNDGWVCEDVIAPDRLKLIESDVSPEKASAWLDAQHTTEAQDSSLTGDMTVTFRRRSTDDP